MNAPLQPAQTGDIVKLGDALINVEVFGTVTNLDSPSLMQATLDIMAGSGKLQLDALVGPRGAKGEAADPIKLRLDSSITDREDLPTLTDSAEDIGTAYYLGKPGEDAILWIWDGQLWVAKAMGYRGPAGITPVISATARAYTVEEMAAGKQSQVTITGTAERPSLFFELAVPRGPRGENATIRDATDYDDATPPTIGQVIRWDGKNYKNTDVNQLTPRMYTVPQAAFTSTPIAVGNYIPICSFDLPAQDTDYQVWASGHMKIGGIDVDFDPFQLQCEVRVSPKNQDPKGGTLVAKGFGNSSQWMSVAPHASTPTRPNDAISPDGTIGRFAGNTQYTLTVLLYTSGLGSVWSFNPTDAQLALQLIPV